MSRKWQIHDARARFSEFLGASITDGPQNLTRRGVEMTVVVPFKEYGE